MSISNVVGNFFKQNVVVYNTKTMYSMYSVYNTNNNNGVIDFFLVNSLLNTKKYKLCTTNLYLFSYFFCKTNSILFLNINNVCCKGNTNSIFKKIKNIRLPFSVLLDNYIKLSLIDKYISIPAVFKSSSLHKNVSFKKNLLIVPKMVSSSIYKYIDTLNYAGIEFQFLRKNKVYNKGRYSRCRQNYRTGVYLCMYLSVVCIFGLYYWFFKFSFNFSYLWWFFIFFVGSFIMPKIVKYRLYEPTTLCKCAFDFFRWVSFLVKSVLH